jgi:signal transduction histidine kinase/ActR/RegA family two-component response regulator
MPPQDDDEPTDALARAQAEIARLTADNARLTELLDVVQDLGRLGVWERDPHTLEGRWDAHVFRFFGYEPTETPSFHDAAQRVHPDDRLDDSFFASLQEPGLHGHRYRIVHPDGSVAHVHSQWRVLADAQGRAHRVIGAMLDDTETHRLALDAQAAHEQLELALSLSGIGQWRYEFATGRIHYDARGQALLARRMSDEGESIETVRSWIHPDDLAAVQEAFVETVASGGPVDTQTRYLHAGGSWRTVLTRRVLQRDEMGQPMRIIGVGLDVTDQQKRTMDALQLAQRLDAAAEAARVGLWSGRIDGGEPEWNAQIYALLGRDPQAGPLNLIDTLRQYGHPDDRERVTAAAQAWLRDSASTLLDTELRIVRADGSVVWLELRGRQEVDVEGTRRAFGVLLDVTRQRETLERLREANERTQLALSAAGMGTWMRHVGAERDHWDEQMYHLRGMAPRPGAMRPEERLSVVLPEDRVALGSAADRMLTSTEPMAYEFRIVRANDGAVRTLASRSIASVDASGRITRRIGVNWDVTEARTVERAQRERELALRESRTKSALFSRVSHELRTPLNAVLGFAQLLLAEGERADTAQRRRRLQQIQAAGESLLALVDGVLDLNEQTEGQGAPVREPVALSEAVERALAPLAGAIARRGLAVDLGDLSPVVTADARRLQQLLTQVLGNAVKFNRESGRIGIGAQRQGPEVVLGVQDQGPGIPDERITRLFEPFDGQAAAAGTGQGIGLAIAQALAQRMGGRIELARTGPEGSLFELRLPLAELQAAAAPAPQAAVLYIEDNEVNMLIVRELLTQRPHIAFHGASDGASGVSSANTLHPALVLVDMQLPDFDGMEVLRRLRADPSTASIPCVALSANAMPEDVKRARAAGFDDYWTKPIDLSAFLSSIDRLLPTA